MGFADCNLCPAETKNTVGRLFKKTMFIYITKQRALLDIIHSFRTLDPSKKCACTLREKNQVWWPRSDLVPGSQEFLRGAKRGVRYCECMSESAALDDDTVRTSSSFFLLHTPGATQQVRNKPEEIFSPLVWHQITGRLPSLISHFLTDGTWMSSACSAFITNCLFLCVCVCVFFLSVRANNSSLLFEFAFVLLLKEVSQPIDSHLICCRSL